MSNISYTLTLTYIYVYNISLHCTFVICKGLTCAASNPLLDGDNLVPDSYFTDSREIDSVNAAPEARLDSGNYGWVTTEADKNKIPPTLFLQASSRKTGTRSLKYQI